MAENKFFWRALSDSIDTDYVNLLAAYQKAFDCAKIHAKIALFNEEKEWKEFPSDWSVEKWEAFKSDLEDAGAIVETKRECPYCFTYNDERLPFVDEKGWVIRLWNNGGKWNLDINMEKHEFDEVIELPALYCLKCGRKLET